ncbi:hypothetical protein ACE38W_00465 [Chitinophaga sp. Hz27]|uniref:hypothetical protein n=1 Tax=Chitinophaga sp. Hz27 TaxID=3347169 RepID=UPI0035D8AA22
MQTFSIDSLALHEMVVVPAFADLVPQQFPFTGLLNEWTVMDNVASSRQIIDIRRVQNILQRRDASCDINYKKVVGATTRKIYTEEIYGATAHCRQEFYQGCLKDWRAKDPVFGDKILPFFQQIIHTDVASNCYFGDVDRVVPVGAQWSTNIFDGIFKWAKKYISAGVIPASSTFQIADNTDFMANPELAYALIEKLYQGQSVMMRAFPAAQKAMYVTQQLADGYQKYLQLFSKEKDGYTILADGIQQLSYQRIPILVVDIWEPIIQELKGSHGHAAILTLRSNFVFGTDKTYGEGEDGKTALMVWYERKDMQWYYQMFLKAGTQIGLPEFFVIAVSSWS